jgi:hypothetical protein
MQPAQIIIAPPVFRLIAQLFVPLLESPQVAIIFVAFWCHEIGRALVPGDLLSQIDPEAC